MTAVDIIKGAPIWVWPLLAYTLFVGVKASKDGSGSVPMSILFGILGVWATIQLTAQLHAEGLWPLYILCVIVGGVAGFYLQKLWTSSFRGLRFQVQGEWFTLILSLVIFSLYYVTGVLEAIGHQAIQKGPWFLLIKNGIILSISFFIGRALLIAIYWMGFHSKK
ncbi:hypothetical protein [Flexibacterium corallicola]|uniref:hypothetical protein n=1 Tax=Flexibacterium corallicola TaxID=3037259 RepID=UPI00286FA229|nr:hypothetical protein [Pseudovibrio sp. M1P-2-3]